MALESLHNSKAKFSLRAEKAADIANGQKSKSEMKSEAQCLVCKPSIVSPREAADTITIPSYPYTIEVVLNYQW